MNNNQGVLYGIIGLLAGIVLTGGIMSFGNAGSWVRSGGMMGSNHMSMSMDDMADELKEKSGDSFDKAFLEMMIDHHQGAIDMANQTLKSTKRPELKVMANDIITAQEKEIAQMKSWQKEWGY